MKRPPFSLLNPKKKEEAGNPQLRPLQAEFRRAMRKHGSRSHISERIPDRKHM